MFKAMVRWVLYHIARPSYRPYAQPQSVGYAGTHEWRGHVVAFRHLDGSLQFSW